MKKLRLVTDGIIHGASVVDEDGQEIGRISEVLIKERAPSLTLVKVGNDEFYPTPADLEKWREIFEQAEKDQDFKIFVNNAVEVKRYYPHGSVEIVAKIPSNEEE